MKTLCFLLIDAMAVLLSCFASSCKKGGHPDHTNVIGSAIYYGFYATDNKTSAFSLFGEITNEGKIQYYGQHEFLDRTAMYKGITLAAGEAGDPPYNFALKASEGILNTVMVMSRRAYNYDTFLDKWGQVYDTTICGIPVTHYNNEGHYFYVDEHWQCLYYVNLGMLNSVTEHVVHQLLHYYPSAASAPAVLPPSSKSVRRSTAV